MKQIRTFQFRLPKGRHDDILDEWGILAGKVIRHIHTALRTQTIQARDLAPSERAEFLRLGKNALKTQVLKHFAITGRQYNGHLQQLMGLWESRRALANLDVERLESRITKKQASITKMQTKIKNDKKAQSSINIALQKAKSSGKSIPLPTKTQSKALLDAKTRQSIKFALHQGNRKLASLRHDLEKARIATRPDCVPDIVFGSKAMMRRRMSIHPNNIEALTRWKQAWNASRSAGFMLIGGCDEAAGNKSCKMTLDHAGKARLDLRMPDGLGQGTHLYIENIVLPKFGRTDLIEAMTRNMSPKSRIALTYRFVRDEDYKNDTFSPWRVCITISIVLPEPKTPTNTLGIDINVDHLALGVINDDGNPIGHWSIPLALRGKTSTQREAIIGDAITKVIEIAHKHNARIVLESLDFSKKKREMGEAGKRRTQFEKKYARMLSSFAYKQISVAIMRSAGRHAISACHVNPAYTSLIGEINYARRYGLTRHQSAAIAIARRAMGCSERINYIHGFRGRRNALPAPEEARRHVWRHWAMVNRERIASAKQARRNQPTHPSNRSVSPDLSGRILSVS